MADTVDLSYIAGFFDGEGCVTCRGPAELKIVFANTDKGVMEWLRERVGGTLSNQRNGALASSTSRGGCYNLSLTPRQSRELAPALIPFVHIERKRRVLEILATMPRVAPNRKATDEELQPILDAMNEVSRLNRPGKPKVITLEEYRTAREKNVAVHQAASQRSRDRRKEVVLGGNT